MLRNFYKKNQKQFKNLFKNEQGNIFFTLFGAVAVVGVLGAVTVSTMRGPLSTMVEVQARTKAESEMAIASRLAMLEATDALDSGDCDGDGFVEPLEFEPGSGPTGGGLLPTSVASSRIDPWGTDYGYCVWDGGTTIDGGTCDQNGTAGYQRLDGDGSASESYTVIAIISAGADQVFDTTCTQGPPSLNKSGDDIVVEYTYASAAVATDGLWNLKSGDPTTAEISKNLEVTGGATFSNGIDLTTSSSALTLGAASMLFPTDDTAGLGDTDCNGANNHLLRVNDDISPPVLEICDGANSIWISATAGATGLWQTGAGNDIYYNTGTPEVGIGTNAPAHALHVVGDALITGDITANTNIFGNEITASTNMRTATLNATGAVDFDTTLNVDGATTLQNTLDAQGTISNSSGDVSIGDNVSVTGASDLQGTIANSTGDIAIGDNLVVTGTSDLQGDISDSTGDLTIADDTIITGTLDAQGTISNSTGNVDIGDTVDISDNLNVTGTLDVDGSGDIDGTLEADDYTWNGNDFTPATCSSGNFNRWDGSSWACEADSSGSGSGGINAGVFDVNETPDPDVVRMKSTVGTGYDTVDFVFGSPQLDDTGDANNDARMFFDKSKGAFRVGQAVGSEWDDSNVGINSMALGNSSTASGNWSVALGSENTASGLTSFTAGWRNTTSSFQSVAIGRETTASAAQAFALGYLTEAAGDRSVAMGREATVTSSGDYSFAFGLGTPSGADPQVSGANSFGIFMGDQGGVDVTAANTMAIMGGTMAIGSVAASTGGSQDLEFDVTGDVGADNYCDSAGNNCFTAASIAAGGSSDIFEVSGGAGSEVVSSIDVNVPYATADFVFGSPQLADTGDANNDSRMFFDKSKGAFRAGLVTGGDWDDGNIGDYSVAMGRNTRASGNQSLAIGDAASATFLRSIAIGNSASAANAEAIAIGSNLTSSGNYSLALGRLTLAGGQSSTAMGQSSGVTGDSSVSVGLQTASQTTRPIVSGTRSAVFFFDGGIADANSAYDFTEDDKFALIGGEFQIDSNSSTAAKGCIRYNDTSDQLEYSDDCSSYTAFTSISSGINTLIDADSDTQIQVEEIADEDHIRFDTAGSERMVIDENGLVGIGTSDPTEALEINGQIKLGEITAFNSGADIQVIRVNPAGTYLHLGSNINDTLIGTTSTLSVIKARTGDLQFKTDGSWNAHPSTDGNVRMVIKNAGDIGIGDFSSDTVDSTLHIASGDIRLDGGAGNEAGCFRFDDTTDMLQFSHDCTTFINMPNGGAATAVIDADSDTQIQVEESADDDTIRFDTAGTERMVIDPSGNVGIGTNAPNAIFEIFNASSATQRIGSSATSYMELVHSSPVSGHSYLAHSGLGSLIISPDYNSPVRLQPGTGTHQFSAGQPFFTIHTANSNAVVAATADVSALRIEGGFGDGVRTYTGDFAGIDLDHNFGDGANATYNASTPMTSLSMTPTMNVNTASTQGYSVVYADVTETSISAGGDNRLLDLRVGGTPMFAVSNTGTLQIDNAAGGSQGCIRYNDTTDQLEFSDDCSTFQTIGAYAAGAIALNDLTDATTDYTTDFNMFLGSGSGAAIASGGQFNIGLGYNALNDLTDGDGNVAIGYNAGALITTGGDNIALGERALDANLTGWNNVAIGEDTLSANTESSNVAIGKRAMRSNTTGTPNIAIGEESLRDNTDGNNNISIGYRAMILASGGDLNVAVGNSALRNNTADRNTAVGHNALISNTSGGGNNALGYSALATNSTGSANAAIGEYAMRYNTVGSYNVAIGHDALNANVSQSRNVAIGYEAMQNANNTATAADSNNVAVGYQALLGSTTAANNTGTRNVAIGANAIDAITSGGENVGVGTSALGANTEGDENTAIGDGAMASNTTGDDNVAVGDDALDANTIGLQNTAVGAQSLSAASIASQNTAVGYRAGNATTGSANTFMGADAGRYNTSGGDNTYIGRYAGEEGTTSAQNTAVGLRALENFDNASTASNNVALGYSALEGVNGSSTGIGNTALGAEAGDSITSGSNNIVIGNGADVADPTADNQLVIGDLISGTLGSGLLTVNGTGALTTPSGTTAQRPGTPVNGMMRYNSDTNQFEMYQNSSWVNLAGASVINDLSDAYTDYATDFNIYLGDSAGVSSSPGQSNIAIGQNALDALDGTCGGANECDSNIAIGIAALGANTLGFYNTAIGYSAFSNVTTGSRNLGVGRNTGGGITTGVRNTFIGDAAGEFTSDVSNNTAVGAQAFYAPTTSGFANVAVGQAAMYDSGSSSFSVVIGAEAGNDAEDSDNNVFIGYQAGSGVSGSTIGADNNIFIGYQAGDSVTTGTSNILIGSGIDLDAATDSNVLKIGSLLTGTLNTGLLTINGTGALTTPSGTTAQRPGTPVNGMMRYNSDTNQFEMYQNSSWVNLAGASVINDLSDAYTDYATDFNIYLGDSAGVSSSPGQHNIALGQNALDALDGTCAGSDDCNRNVAIGYQALTANTTGYMNTAIGYNAMASNQTGIRNTAIGPEVLDALTSGYNNIGMGRSSLSALGSGNSNVSIGNGAMQSLTSGSENVAIGSWNGGAALSSMTSGSGNIAIGRRAGSSLTSGSDNILIGRTVDASTTTSSNELNIGGTLYGNLSTDQLGLGVADAAAIDATAILELDSTTRGFLPPRMTTAQRDAIGSPSTGLHVYNTTTNTYDYYNGSAWTSFATTAGSALWTDNTTHITREGINILNAGETMESAGFDAGNPISGLVMFSDRNTIIGGSTGGTDSILVGTNSFSWGSTTTASGDASAAFGVNNNAGAAGSFVAGESSNTGGSGRAAIGTVVSATGSESIALGSSGSVSGIQSMFIGLGEAGGTQPTVSGNQSIGIFMNAQDSVDLAASRTMLIAGGSVIIDPADPATQLTARAALDVGAATDAIVTPSGTTAQRPGTPVNGMMRYNTTTNQFEMYQNSAWTNLAGASVINDLSDAVTDYATDFNMFMGDNAGASIASGGQYNIGIGQNAGDSITTGDRNIAIGYNAAPSKVDEEDNIAIGYNAMQFTNLGDRSIAIGSNSMGGNNGFDTVAIGYQTATAANADNSVIIGSEAGRELAGNSHNNVIMGSDAGLGVNSVSTSVENSVFIGRSSGTAITTGDNNIFLGYQSGDSTTTGSNNILIGYDVDLDAATDSNVLKIGDLLTGTLGSGLLTVNGTGALTTPSGTTAQRPGTPVNGMMRYNTTTNQFEMYQNSAWTNLAGASVINDLSDAITDYATDNNMFLGENSGANIASGGTNNLGLGELSLNALTTGDDNLAIGIESQRRTTTGSANVSIGPGTLIWNTTGDNNIAVGYQSLLNNSTGADNVAIGTTAMYDTTTGDSNIAFGTGALRSNAEKSRNVAIGSLAMQYAYDGSAGSDNTYNTAVGYTALQGSTTAANNTGTYNTAIGGRSMDGNTSGTNNTAVGADSMGNNTTGSTNVAVGTNALGANSTGDRNTAIGYNALVSNVARERNTALGYEAMRYADDTTTTGSTYNTALGYIALRGSPTASSNTGVSNTAVGAESLDGNTSGSQNTAVGRAALGSNSTGNQNVAIGLSSGSSVTDGDNNVFLGYQAGDATTTGSNNIVIGYDIDTSGATVSNELNIGGAIYGDLANDYIGIANASPDVELDVTGDIEYTGTITDVSDRRLKDNIAPLNKHGALLDKLNQIDTYSFTMKGDEAGRTEFGVMAQELEKIFPELVHTAQDEMGTKSVNYTGLIAPMIEATKELYTENAALKSEIKEIKSAQIQTTAVLNDLSKQVALLNKMAGNNVGKASTESYLMVLLALFGGMIIGLVIRYKKET